MTDRLDRNANPARTGHGRMTRHGPLSRGARRLVAEYVRSTATLDLVMLMRREPARWWTRDEVCDELRCPPGWATQHLAELHAAGLLAADPDGAGASDPRYAFRPRDERLAGAADALAAAYSTDSRAVARYIFSVKR